MIVAEDIKTILQGQSVPHVVQMAEELGFPITTEESLYEFIADVANKTHAITCQPKDMQLSDTVEHVVYEISYYWFRLMNPNKERTYMMDQLYADVKYELRFRPKGSIYSLVGNDITFPIGLYKAVMTDPEVIDAT
jgi:hypothetical protein